MTTSRTGRRFHTIVEAEAMQAGLEYAEAMPYRFHVSEPAPAPRHAGGQDERHTWLPVTWTDWRLPVVCASDCRPCYWCGGAICPACRLHYGNGCPHPGPHSVVEDGDLHPELAPPEAAHG